MNHKAVVTKNIYDNNKHRHLALSLGLLLFSIYLFIYRGGFHSIDEVSMFAVTENLVTFGHFNTDQIAWTQWTTIQAEAQGFFGIDGHVYSKKGLALSLAQAPLYWLGLILPGLGMLQTVSLLNALVTAATSLLVFMFVYRLNFSLRTAVVCCLLFGLVTIANVYTKYLFSEPLAGFLLLLATYTLFAYRQEGGLQYVVVAGLAAGLAVLTRANNLFLLPVFGLYLLWIQLSAAQTFRVTKKLNNLLADRNFVHSTIRTVTAFVLALAIPGLIMLTYNAIRSGNPLQTGYDLTLFSSNALLGFYKLLFSPLRGLFVYSPILLLSLPGWWHLRRLYPAESWHFAGLVGITLFLFSFWSSGEGLSWGSRFLVPLIPFFTISLAPIIAQVTSRNALRLAFYALLLLSGLIQVLAVAINPWVFLARMQAEFGGEFFLEKTAALYDFRYSQIFGQFQAWSLENSDVAWWQPWGFDGLAFGLSLALVLLSGWLLWSNLAALRLPEKSPPHPRTPAPLLLSIPITIAVTYLLLLRYNQTDQQFGPPDDTYTRALNRIVSQAAPNETIITVAQYHYHVPMNRFKTRLPLLGFAQQIEPLPATALPLLSAATTSQNSWLVTVRFPPAAPDNATEQWLALNTFKATDEWLRDDVRLLHFGNQHPTTSRQIETNLGREMRLIAVNLLDNGQPGQLLPVEFTWQAFTQPRLNYNLFLQLLNLDGILVAQHDSPPNGGYTPTSSWQAGRQITSRHALQLPTDLSAGNYRLIAGLYNPTTGERLPFDTGGDFVELGNITIIEEQDPGTP
jgi:hypothetical protein